jgi:hypothetical protein
MAMEAEWRRNFLRIRGNRLNGSEAITWGSARVLVDT